jgi:branched-chain amino acid transport system ATP-binding protein
MNLLTIDSLYAHDPGVRCPIDVRRLTVRERDLCLVLGHSSAGKSLLLRTIAGLWPHRGSVMLGNRSVGSLPAAERSRAGLVLVSPKLGNFSGLTVEDNVHLATYVGASDHVAAKQRSTRLWGWFPSLYERRRELARGLPRLEQAHLALARALALDPRVLLIDEISYGLSTEQWQALANLLLWIRWSFGTTIVLAEARPARGWNLADWVYVLSSGRIIAAGPPDVPPPTPDRPRPAQAAGEWRRKNR